MRRSTRQRRWVGTCWQTNRAGFGLHWEALDVDLSVPALMAESFGTKTWMRELARRAGSVKAAAARVNGAKGGRPKKVG